MIKKGKKTMNELSAQAETLIYKFGFLSEQAGRYDGAFKSGVESRLAEKQLREYMLSLESELELLREEARWRDCYEEHPPEDSYYLTVDEDSFIAQTAYVKGIWYAEDELLLWRPMPKLPDSFLQVSAK